LAIRAAVAEATAAAEATALRALQAAEAAEGASGFSSFLNRAASHIIIVPGFVFKQQEERVIN